MCGQDLELRPVLPLIRMGRGKMMGVDHNKASDGSGPQRD
jgi:hypothetical protein